MITAIFLKMILADVWQDEELESDIKILITTLMILLLIPLAIVFDIALIPIELIILAIYLLRKEK